MEQATATKNTYGKYRRPGRWRASEVREELLRRLNADPDTRYHNLFDLSTPKGRERMRNWWNYLIRIKVIPLGDLRGVVTKAGGGVLREYSDELLEEVVARVRTCIIHPPVGPPE